MRRVGIGWSWLIAGAVSAQDAAPTAAAPGPFELRAARRAAFTDTRVKAAIDAGLQWLTAHQDKDGRWDCDRFAKHDGQKPGDGGAPQHDVGATGLALLALLSQADVRFDDACDRGARWLVEQQDPASGLFGVNAAHDFIYDHAIAALAAAEYATLRRDARSRGAASAAIAYLERHRNQYAAWRYQPRDNDNDASVTSWCLAAYGAARRAGLTVPTESIACALWWLDGATDADGRTGYSKVGESSSRQPGDHAVKFPATNGEAMTAAAWHARAMVGVGGGTPEAAQAAKLLLARAPQSAPAAYDLYYWFHGSQAAAHLGPQFARAWHAATQKALLPLQGRDGAAAGSWAPTDAWGAVGGRVITTAFALLCLQAPYRGDRYDVVGRLPDQQPFRRLRTAWAAARYHDVDQALRELEVPAAAAELRAIAADVRQDLELQCLLANGRMRDLDRVKEIEHELNHERATAIAAAFGGLPVGLRAKAVLERYETEPKLRTELTAARRLREIARRHAKEPDKRNDAYRKLIAQYPDTFAAVRAKSRLD